MTAHPLTGAQVKTVLKTTPLLRDQALLTLGFQTGFRISELLSLTVGEVTDSYG
jgi:integrase